MKHICPTVLHTTILQPTATAHGKLDPTWLSSGWQALQPHHWPSWDIRHTHGANRQKYIYLDEITGQLNRKMFSWTHQVLHTNWSNQRQKQVFFIKPSQVSPGRKVTYCNFVCTLQPNKSKVYKVRITVQLDRLNAYQDVSHLQLAY